MYIVEAEKKEVVTQHLVPDGVLVRVENRYKNHNGNLTFIKKGSLHGVIEDIYLVGNTRKVHVIDKSTVDNLGKTGSDTTVKARVTPHDWVNCINRQGRLAYETKKSDFVDVYTPIEIGMNVPVKLVQGDISGKGKVLFISKKTNQFIVEYDDALYLFGDTGLPVKDAMKSDCGLLQLAVKCSRIDFARINDGEADVT